MTFKIIESHFEDNTGNFHMRFARLCGEVGGGTPYGFGAETACATMTREEVERIVAELTALLHEYDEINNPLADWEKDLLAKTDEGITAEVKDNRLKVSVNYAGVEAHIYVEDPHAFLSLLDQ